MRDVWLQDGATDMPRNNNHCEGYNNKVNYFIPNDRPNIYGLISSLRGLETQTIFNSICIENGQAISFRRPVGVARDARLETFQRRFADDQDLVDHMERLVFFFQTP